MLPFDEFAALSAERHYKSSSARGTHRKGETDEQRRQRHRERDRERERERERRKRKHVTSHSMHDAADRKEDRRHDRTSSSSVRKSAKHDSESNQRSEVREHPTSTREVLHLPTSDEEDRWRPMEPS